MVAGERRLGVVKKTGLFKVCFLRPDVETFRTSAAQECSSVLDSESLICLKQRSVHVQAWPACCKMGPPVCECGRHKRTELYCESMRARWAHREGDCWVWHRNVAYWTHCWWVQLFPVKTFIMISGRRFLFGKVGVSIQLRPKSYRCFQ